ncbi:uncharacterized protein BJ171DRAFT_620877, partial [Polychytrium aggregatum]|uniref:uncharacterized protein n=1 Tax=Polychytrium aggregatum TaxID=110093 RepID=UPI0022FDCD36
ATSIRYDFSLEFRPIASSHPPLLQFRRRRPGSLCSGCTSCCRMSSGSSMDLYTLPFGLNLTDASGHVSPQKLLYYPDAPVPLSSSIAIAWLALCIAAFALSSLRIFLWIRQDRLLWNQFLDHELESPPPSLNRVASPTKPPSSRVVRGSVILVSDSAADFQQPSARWRPPPASSRRPALSASQAAGFQDPTASAHLNSSSSGRPSRPRRERRAHTGRVSIAKKPSKAYLMSPLAPSGGSASRRSFAPKPIFKDRDSSLNRPGSSSQPSQSSMLAAMASRHYHARRGQYSRLEGDMLSSGTTVGSAATPPRRFINRSL